jgi:cellulose biosynthesis protein BcsQ
MSSIPNPTAHRPGAPLIAVGSGRGGTGKSTLSLALGYALAAHHQRRIAWVDCDSQATGTGMLGLRPAANPLAAEPERRSGLLVFAGGEALGAASPEQIRRHLARAAGAADLVIADMSPALTDSGHTAVLSYPARLVLAVVNVEPGSLAPAARLAALARTASIPCRVIANQLEDNVTAGSVMLVLERLYQGDLSPHVLRRNRLAKAAIARRVPLTEFRPKAQPSAAIFGLAADLVEEGLA